MVTNATMEDKISNVFMTDPKIKLSSSGTLKT